MLSLLLLILTSQAHAVYPHDRLQVDTTSGLVQGIWDKATPDVAKFLGIPYAEAPTGSRRWLPPLPKKRQQGKIDATKFGPACVQWDYDPALQPNMNNQDVPELGIQPPDYWAEDCLSLSIWSPERDNKPPGHSGTRLPVIVWAFGGGFSQGGANVPYQDPTPWVQRSKKHIVVSINHRVGLLGYPNAKGLPLTEQNLGLLDLRLALEWVRDNIAKFGGDAKRISLMGQSSGAMSADYYNYANPNDKIVSGYILHSGTAHIPFENLDTAQSNFTALAHHFNCTDSDPKAHIDCLRKVPAANLMTILKKYADEMIQPGLTFIPIIDNRTVFTDAEYTIRAHSGKLSRKPVLAGTTVDEGVGFVLPYNQTHGPPKAECDEMTNWLIFCPLVETSRDRFVANTTTFRYLYAGNFSNVSPRAWQGAYHSSDLPMVFGTYDIVRGKGTEFQKKVSEKMQDLWVKFAEDPVRGLLKEGWQPYQSGQGEVVVFGKTGQVMSRINETTFEAPCNGTKSGNNHHHMI